MKITFLGAAKTVTGSCYLIETERFRFLIDCGLHQGHSKETMLNEEPFSFHVSDIDFILLTHAHIDHSGRIPKLYADGFRNKIFATKPTVELCGIMLPDSGHIQETENEWENRKRERAGKKLIKPLYTMKNGVDCLDLFKTAEYGQVIQINEDVKVRFNDAGHILGSAILEIWVTEEGKEVKVVFSGDLGNKGIPLLRDPEFIDEADYLVIESTYGNRLHDKEENKVERFVDIIMETIEKKGNVIIPSFAVGRTQEVIYYLNQKREKYDEKLKQLYKIPVYVDSPLATSATEIFRNNSQYFDEEARAYLENGDNPLDFPGLHFTQSAEESKELNQKNESMIIISASGMCDAGRIKHHLKHNLWHYNSTVIFVGYQAVGTLGRSLVDGAKRVKIFGEEISVKARIEMIDGFSGHADRDGLLEWIGAFKRKPQKIFIVHGEEDAQKEFSNYVTTEFGIKTAIPSRGEAFNITADSVEECGEKCHETYQFKRQSLVEILDTIKDEFEELSEILKTDLKEEKSEIEVENLKAKLKKLENSIVEVLKE